MQETPIARLARRWVERNNRPAGELNCAGPHCDSVVLPGEGIWIPGARSIVCSEPCAMQVEMERRA